MPILSVLIWLPIAAAVVLTFFPKNAYTAIKGWGLFWSTAIFVISLGLLRGWDDAHAGFQFVENIPWIPQWGINYGLGVDGISLWLVLLTTFLTPIIFLSAWNAIHKHPKEYVIAFLVMEAAMVGAFVATDLLLFYVFFELMLLPMYLVIGVWGGANRVYAAIKFFLFTIAGSLLMLLGIIYMAFLHFHESGIWSFAVTDFYGMHYRSGTTEALLFFAFALPFFPNATAKYAKWLIALSVIGVIYGALVAWVQPDMKKLVAYSSVSHLGFCVLGIFAFNQTAIEGSILQMVNHGLSTGALFLLVGVIYERRHTRMLADYGGIARTMPLYATLFVIAMLSSVGLPGLNGFVGEFLILAGSYKTHPTASVIAATGVILAAIYLLWLVQRLFFGPITNEENRVIPDIAWNEIAAMVPLIVLMVWIGVHPNTFLRKMTPSVQKLLTTVHSGGERGQMMVADALTRRFAAPSPASGRGTSI